MSFVRTDPFDTKIEKLDYSAVTDLPIPVAVLAGGRFQPTIKSASWAFAHAIGKRHGSLAGRRLEDVFQVETARQIRAALLQVALTRKAARILMHSRIRGRKTAHDVVVHPSSTGDGSNVLTIEARWATAAAETHEAELSEGVGPLTSGLIYIYDLTSQRVRHIHKDLADLVGLDRGPLDLPDVLKRIHPDDVEKTIEYLREMGGLADDQSLILNVRFQAPDGGWISLQVRSRVLTRRTDGDARLMIGAAADVTERDRLRGDLADASMAIANAEIMERRRIGRELHDSTAQHLVAIDLSLGMLERRGLFSESDLPILRDIRTSLSNAHQEVRTFSYMLHPPKLKHHGLEATLRAFATGFGKRAGLEIDMEVTGLRRVLPAPLELAFFRITQEGLMNVHRHAQARHVALRLHQAPEEVWLEVEDDGVGLSSEGPPVEADSGVGLSGMQARMRQLGGQLLLASGGNGMRLRASAPVEAWWGASAELPHRARPGQIESLAPGGGDRPHLSPNWSEFAPPAMPAARWRGRASG